MERGSETRTFFCYCRPVRMPTSSFNLSAVDVVGSGTTPGCGVYELVTVDARASSRRQTAGRCQADDWPAETDGQTAGRHMERPLSGPAQFTTAASISRRGKKQAISMRGEAPQCPRGRRSYGGFARGATPQGKCDAECFMGRRRRHCCLRRLNKDSPPLGSFIIRLLFWLLRIVFFFCFCTIGRIWVMASVFCDKDIGISS